MLHLLQSSTTSVEPLIVPDSLQKAYMARAYERIVSTDYSELLNSLMRDCLWVAIKVVLALIIYIIGRQIIRWVIRIMERTFEARKVETSLRVFLRSLVKVVMMVVLLLVIVQTLGVNTSSILALFASAGLAIGMALSGTLQNFAGGVVLLLLRPYKVGDYITAQGQSGTVDEIGLFSTRLKTTDNRRIYIPNNSISTSIIDNFSQSKLRRVDWSLSVAYGDDVAALRTVILERLNSDERVLRAPAEPVVYLSQLADSAVVLSVRVWAKNTDYWPLYFEMNEWMYNELPKHGAHFPFPQLDVHITSTTDK